MNKDKPWLKPDSLYVSKHIKKGLVDKLEVKPCKYCSREINTNDIDFDKRHNDYCSRWCYEIDNPIKVKHLCKECGIVVEESRTKTTNHVYYKAYCNEHDKRNKFKII